MAGKYDITCDQGSTLRRVITWKNPDLTLVDLTGYTARMHVRTAVDATDVVLECTTENGRILLGGALGTVTILVEATAMEAIDAGSYKYDLELIDASATPEVTRLVEGKFKVVAEVTR